jgi:hypothetical protein
MGGPCGGRPGAKGGVVGRVGCWGPAGLSGASTTSRAADMAASAGRLAAASRIPGHVNHPSGNELRRTGQRSRLAT